MGEGIVINFKPTGSWGQFMIYDENGRLVGETYRSLGIVYSMEYAPLAAEDLRAIADKLDELNKEKEHG